MTADRTLLRTAFRRGVIAALPFVLVVGPFGLLFGVVATDTGLTVFEALAFSIAALAGAAQFAALQLAQDGAPLLIVVLTAAAVNLRMAMYSASLAPHLGPAKLWQRAVVSYCLVDQSYLVAVTEYERAPESPLAEKLAFFFGSALPLCPLWFGSTWVGAMFGKSIPRDYALDFAVPVAFLAMIAPVLRTGAQYAAAVVSVGVTLALWWMPYSSGLLVAGLTAMVTGTAVETIMERKA
ncbi:MAG: AzlC family ABC transporter permease [Gemmobacter sp.]|jgi:predicted branched-subunit amino acid permease|nr:AzlC family ABC transporter permease [Gemmobacter sp.]